jgi:hypothetical protein
MTVSPYEGEIGPFIETHEPSRVNAAKMQAAECAEITESSRCGYEHGGTHAGRRAVRQVRESWPLDPSLIADSVSRAQVRRVVRAAVTDEDDVIDLHVGAERDAPEADLTRTVVTTPDRMPKTTSKSVTLRTQASRLSHLCRHRGRQSIRHARPQSGVR